MPDRSEAATMAASPDQPDSNNRHDIPAALRAAAHAWGTHPAILTDDLALSLAEVDQLTEALALDPRVQGIHPGDRVGILCPNGAEFALLYLGLLKAGAILVPLNLLLSAHELAYILGDAGVTALYAHPGFLQRATDALGNLDRGRPQLIEIQPNGDWRGPATVGHLLGRSEPGQVASTHPNPGPNTSPNTNRHRHEEPAVILYTSGTTGQPKGAVLTHANLIANARATAEALQIQAGADRVLVVLPLFHAFAATVGLLTPLLHGAAMIPLPRFDPERVSRAVARQGVTLFLGVPSLFQALIRLPDERLADWRGLRHCVSGGAALPVALLESFEQRFGIPILEGDGPTECGPVTCVNPVDGPRKPGSVGLPLPGVKMRIAGPDGNSLPDGEHGEVCVRGPSVMRGYWRQPEASAASFHGDWFRTGDLGYRDSDGYIFLVDRIKDLIIRNGMNVYPRVIEEVLSRHPQVQEAAVVGEPDARHGEIPIAFVVAAPTADDGDQQANDTLITELRAWCREYLGRHEWPRRIELRDSLPRNAAGKILKRELRRTGEVERGITANG